MAFGTLRVSVRTEVGFQPIENATVTIRNAGSEEVLEVLRTNESGNTDTIELPAPDVDYSLEPQEEVRPYSTYDLTIESPEMDTVQIDGTQIIAGEEALQDVRGSLEEDTNANRDIDITANTLWGNFPAKIPEEELKPIPGEDDDGFVVLPSVVIPEYIIVHDGRPDQSAPNYWIPYANYIKNVASSEIYASWPESTLIANVLAIMSFTLNRVYTEWYPSRGYPFTITSSTAYDQNFVYGRNIYSSISRAVDTVLNNYITRPTTPQPLLTQYCDGKRTTCPGWLSQWGSKSLGDQGYSAINILRYYYGYGISLDTASRTEGVPSSYPGTPVRYGSTGSNVLTIQRQLQRIRQNYPAIPNLSVDGIFGRGTEASVRQFQSIFNLTPDGIVGKGTWYRLSQVYTAVSGLAEL